MKRTMLKIKPANKIKKISALNVLAFTDYLFSGMYRMIKPPVNMIVLAILPASTE